MRFAIMNFVSGCYSDVGKKKKTNQDSMLIQQMKTPYGNAFFSVVCDGMGGLKKGELASAEVIYAFAEWFSGSFPSIISGGTLDAGRLHGDWTELLHSQDRKISSYGAHHGFNLGTTFTCLLIYGNQYYVCNVGDSRVYLLSDKLYQITHDHSLVQQQLDQGIITFEQSLVAPNRSVLLQCVGASDYVEPDFFTGAVQKNTGFVLCCDGFHHLISPEEMYGMLHPSKMKSENVIESGIKNIAEIIKGRGELDNISAVFVNIS